MGPAFLGRIDGPAAAHWFGQHEPVDQPQEALIAAVDEKSESVRGQRR